MNNYYTLTRQIALSQEQILKMLKNNNNIKPVHATAPMAVAASPSQKIFIATTPPINRQLAISEKQITKMLK